MPGMEAWGAPNSSVTGCRNRGELPGIWRLLAGHENCSASPACSESTTMFCLTAWPRSPIMTPLWLVSLALEGEGLCPTQRAHVASRPDGARCLGGRQNRGHRASRLHEAPPRSRAHASRGSSSAEASREFRSPGPCLSARPRGRSGWPPAASIGDIHE